jgi:hypothetical protein
LQVFGMIVVAFVANRIRPQESVSFPISDH